MITNLSINVCLESYSIETIECIKDIPGITLVIEPSPENKDKNMEYMLLIYTPYKPSKLVETLSKINNVKYAEILLDKRSIE